MIEYIKIRNFLSIKDEITVDFSSDRRWNKKDNVFFVWKKFLTKNILLYGANASGKSNIVFAMKKMRDIVEKSAKQKITSNPFKFDVDFNNQPTMYEVKFLFNEVMLLI